MIGYVFEFSTTKMMTVCNYINIQNLRLMGDTGLKKRREHISILMFHLPQEKNLPFLHLLDFHCTRENTFAWHISAHGSSISVFGGGSLPRSVFYRADTALRLAPLVCIIGVSPHRQHTAKVYYGVLFQYNFLNLQVPVSI